MSRLTPAIWCARGNSLRARRSMIRNTVSQNVLQFYCFILILTQINLKRQASSILTSSTVFKGFRILHLTSVKLVLMKCTFSQEVSIVVIIIIRVFCPRAGPSLQAQEPRLQFCWKRVFHHKLRNHGWSFTRDWIGAVASRCLPHPTLSLASEQTIKDLKRPQGHQRGGKENGFG